MTAKNSEVTKKYPKRYKRGKKKYIVKCYRKELFWDGKSFNKDLQKARVMSRRDAGFVMTRISKTHNRLMCIREIEYYDESED